MKKLSYERVWADMAQEKPKKSVEYTINFGSFGTLLAILFIGLKLTGFIAWGWLWALAPLWLPWAMFGAFFLLMLALTVLLAIFSGPKRLYR